MEVEQIDQEDNVPNVIATNNPYLPDVVTEGCCSTLKLTLENMDSNINSVNVNCKYLTHSLKLIGTEKDSIQFRNNLHTTLSSTKSVIDDTCGILQHIGLIFGGQNREQKLQIQYLFNSFKITVQSFRDVQKEVSVRLKWFYPPEFNCTVMKPVAIQYTRTPYGGRRKLYLYQQKVYKNVELENERLIEQEEALRKLDHAINDITEMLQELNTATDVHEESTGEGEIGSQQSNENLGTEQDSVQPCVVQQRKRYRWRTMWVVFLLVLIFFLFGSLFVLMNE